MDKLEPALKFIIKGVANSERYNNDAESSQVVMKHQ